MQKRLSSILKTKLDTILFLRGDGNYSAIHHTNEQRTIFSTTLRVCVDQQPTLLRIHKSYAVNPKYVIQLNVLPHREGTVTMRNGMVLPIARRRIDYVRQQLTEQLTAKEQKP